MNRRKVVRTLSVFAAALLSAVAIWSAGVRPGERAPPTLIGGAREAPPPSGREQGRGPEAATQLTHSTAPAEQRLVLFATSPGRNSVEGSAALGTAADTATTYAAGALLANRMRIAEIHPGFVVLERNGVRQRLDLQGASQVAPTSEPAKSRDLTVLSELLPAPVPTPLRDALSEVVRAMAFYEQDELVGLELRAGSRREVFTQLGLEEGDVLVEVDGSPVTNVQEAKQRLRSVMEGTALPVRIRRGGALAMVTLDGVVAARSAGETAVPITP